MTESHWDRCTDPEPMLVAIHGRASDRKLRLFLCACIRSVPLLDGRTAWEAADRAGQLAVTVAEQYADGITSQADLQQVRQGALRARMLAEQPMYGHGGSPGSPVTAGQVSAYDAACACLQVTQRRVGPRFLSTSSGRLWDLVTDDRRRQTALLDAQRANLLRHVLGNPFVRAVPVPAVSRMVLDLAEAVYRGQDAVFALHDALLDAGQPDLARHFARPNHPRGCHLLDQFLGRA